MFNQPSNTGTFFRPRDHVDHLILIIEAHGSVMRYDSLREEEMREVTVDMVDLDAENPEILANVILSHKGLTLRVKDDATMTLGRIGTVKAKNGKDAFVLNGFTPEDGERAAEWVEANKTRPTFNAPSAPRPAATKAKPAPAPHASEPAEDPWATTDA